MKTEHYAQVCIHFTGIGQSHCKRNVLYAGFTAGRRLPCLWPQPGIEQHTCNHYEAEGIERYREQERLWRDESARVDRARAVIVREQAASGSNQGAICGTGTLRWTRAACNGHISAMCSTLKCVRWIE